MDGYITGPDDGPQYGLGRGGERLHYWVMGGPWTYEGGHQLPMHGPDEQFYDELVSTVGSGNRLPRVASGSSRTSTPPSHRRQRQQGTRTSLSVAVPTSSGSR